MDKGEPLQKNGAARLSYFLPGTYNVGAMPSKAPRRAGPRIATPERRYGHATCRFGEQTRLIMGLPFLNGKVKKPGHLVSIDLGGRVTKAVQIEQREGGLALTRYALVDAPICEKTPSPELLAEHLKSVHQALDTKIRSVSLALDVNDSIVRHTQLPPMPISDMRQVLKTSSKNYLQQDLPGYVFDCFVPFPRVAEKPAAAPKPVNGSLKQRVLVAGTKQQIVQDLQAAIRGAGLTAACIVPGLIGPVNAFEKAMREIFEREAVALVDIGFKSTSICLLDHGELALSRVVAIGGDRLTAGLAQALGVSYAEAESIKIGIPAEVQANLEPLVQPLGRELRASIDCFEHQADKAVSQVFMSGGSASSEFIVQTLQVELMAECKRWNPVSFLQMALPGQQSAEIDSVAPQLTVAVGAALAVL
jgi:type IV pilus assembly protein PilM